MECFAVEAPDRSSWEGADRKRIVLSRRFGELSYVIEVLTAMSLSRKLFEINKSNILERHALVNAKHLDTCEAIKLPTTLEHSDHSLRLLKLLHRIAERIDL